MERDLDFNERVRLAVEAIPDKHNQKCARYDCLICNVDERTPIELLAATMGYVTGRPADLEEIMTENYSLEDLLDMGPDCLAQIYDAATTREIPVGITGNTTSQHFVNSDLLVMNKHLLVTEETKTVKGSRPKTPSEREAHRQEALADETRRQAVANQRKLDRLEARLEKTQNEIYSQRQLIEGSGWG